jgi:hypothetical protein
MLEPLTVCNRPSPSVLECRLWDAGGMLMGCRWDVGGSGSTTQKPVGYFHTGGSWREIVHISEEVPQLRRCYRNPSLIHSNSR